MIRYFFTFDATTTARFAVDVHGDTSAEPPGLDVPDWLSLAHFRCEGCELPPDSRKTCPAAFAIRPVVEAFSCRMSYETVHVVVQSAHGKTETTLAVQDALRSVVGLLLALSSCPVMRMLRPMAHYHLPFGTREHTMFRFVGTYLIAQHLRHRAGQTPDWDLQGLLGLFGRLHKVNKRLADRIRAASDADATVNSLIFLDTFATSAEMDVEDALPDLEPLFAAYLD